MTATFPSTPSPANLSSKVRLELPPAPASETGPVKIWEEPVEMLTYVPAAPDAHPVFLEKRVYQGSSGRVYPLPVIDRIETTPVLRRWRAIHLENQFLRVMVLPEIGGRIHVAMNKLTGYDFIYRQNVIKPALVGLAGPWISGGIEFNWPQHHRPATFMPVETTIERHEDASIIWCSDHDPMERMKGMHGICLHDGKALLEVMVRLYNRTTDTRTFLWWANVATHVHERYQSFFPRDVQFVADHAKRATTTYPLSLGSYYGIDYGARAHSGIDPQQLPTRFAPNGFSAPNDLGWYANIPVPTSYMIANSKGDYFGGYDHLRGEGIVAVSNHHTQPGKKQWTWGNHEFGYAWDRSLTDNDGPYIELMMGAYTDNQPDFSYLAPGETKSFSQYWYPITEIGVPDLANCDLALRMEIDNDVATAHLYSTEDRSDCTIRVECDGNVLKDWRGELRVASPLHLPFMLPSTRVHARIQLTAMANGKVLLNYKPSIIEPAEPPAVAVEPLPPEEIHSSDELFLTGLHLEQYRHPTRSSHSYWMEALKRDPGDARSNLAIGKYHKRRGEYKDSVRHLRAAIKRLQKLNPNPADGEPYYELGLTLQLMGNADEAYDAFYKATWVAGWAAPAYHRLAEIDCARENWHAALDHLDRSLIKSSDNLGALGLKALVLQRMQRKAEAECVVEQASHLDKLDMWQRYLKTGQPPHDGQQCLDLCFDLLRASFKQETYALLRLALAAPDPEQPDGSRTLQRYLLASVARNLDRKTEAFELQKEARQSSTIYVFPHRLEELALLQETLAVDPSDAHAHLFLGNLLYDKRRHEQAMDHWQHAVNIDESLVGAWRNLAIARYNVSHDTKGALTAFEIARRNAPTDSRLLYEQIQLMRRIGRPPVELLHHLQADWPMVLSRDELAVEAATVFNNLGKPQEALQVLLSRKFQPWEGGEGRVLAQYIRANILLAIDELNKGRPLPAQQRLDAALKPPHSLAEARHILQNISAVHYWRGIADKHAGTASEAQANFEKAAGQRSDFRQMRVEQVSSETYWSAMALRELGREEDALQTFHEIESYAKALKREPAKIDFFATSLPNMLLFDDDIQARREMEAEFLLAQSALGLGGEEGFALLNRVLTLDPHHTGAIDLLRMNGR